MQNYHIKVGISAYFEISDALNDASVLAYSLMASTTYLRIHVYNSYTEKKYSRKNLKIIYCVKHIIITYPGEEPEVKKY